jgi:hypothetical protein
MGEFLFTIGYGGSLLVIALCMRAFLQKMERQNTATQQIEELEKEEGTSKKTSYGKVGI